jgi:peptidoglycan/LPS O-acetylase OafA/YrhL
MRPIEPTDLAPGTTRTESVPAPSINRESRFPVLDGLRGFAAVGVTIIHYLFGPCHKLPWLDRITNVLDKSPLSIDIFFVLSGFLIGGILLRTRNSPDYYRTFYRRRFYRIFPVYYAWFAIFCLLYFFGQGWGFVAPQGYSGAFYLFSFAFFFQNFIPSFIESTFIVAPTWSLVVEEHFYLVAPLCVRRMSLRRLVHSLLTVILLTPLFRGVLFKFVGHRSSWADIASRIWPPCRGDALAMGVLLAIIWSSPDLRAWIQKRPSLFVWGMFASSGLAILLAWMAESNFSYCRFFHVSLGRTTTELAGFCLIVYLICSPQSGLARFFSSKIMRELGKISYCLYVIHWGVYWMIFRFVLHMRFGERLWVDLAVVPIALALSIAIATLSWKYFELPLLQRGHRLPQPAEIHAIPGRQPQIA